MRIKPIHFHLTVLKQSRFKQQIETATSVAIFYILDIVNLMKKYLLIILLLLSACSSFQNFQEQPVLTLANNTYKTTCNGIAEGWDSCFRKAQRTCPNGYNVLDKIQTNDFVHRELSFSCKQ